MLCWDSYGLKTEEGVNELLLDLGHFKNNQPDRESAIISYQQYSGLSETGRWSTEETDRLYERICSCPDIQSQNTAKGHWEFAEGEPHLIKLWRTVRGAPTNSSFVQKWLEGAKWWEAENDLSFEFVNVSRDCHIWATYQRIDGRNNVLAWSMLPNRHQRYRTRFLEQRYDPLDMNSDSRIERVSAHEIGHALGIDHIPANRGVALMNPFDNPSITNCRPLDNQEASERYGVKNNNPDPVDPPPTDCPVCPEPVECDKDLEELGRLVVAAAKADVLVAKKLEEYI